MSKSNDGENDIQKYTFQGIPPSWNLATLLYISLHTANPDEAGDQSTHECVYTGYQRLSINRDITGWLVNINAATNAVILTFGECTVGSEIITHVGIGTDLNGPGRLLQSYQLTNPLTIGIGVAPYFAIGALQINEE